MDKIKNFLYYNWLKLLAIIFVTGFVAVSFYQCSSRVEIDLGIMYVGEDIVSDTLPKLAERVKTENELGDIDGDGVVNVNSRAITIPKSKELIMERQVLEQIQVEIISGDNILYILNSDILVSYAVDENFLDISSFSDGFLKEEDCLSYPDGRIYAINLSGNPILAEYGIDDEDMYIAVRNCPDDQKNSTKVQNALTAMQYILGGNKNGK